MEQTDSEWKGEERETMVERRGRNWTTWMNDPWMWTAVGVEDGMGGQGKKGKNYDNRNRIRTKVIKKKNFCLFS